MSMSETAMTFFDACETGKGWEVCKEWCTDGATFSCQADALAEITTLPMKDAAQFSPSACSLLPGLGQEDSKASSISRTGVDSRRDARARP